MPVSKWETANGRSIAFEFHPAREGWACAASLLDGRKTYATGATLEEALARAREQVAEILIGPEANRLDALLRRLAEK